MFGESNLDLHGGGKDNKLSTGYKLGLPTKQTNRAIITKALTMGNKPTQKNVEAFAKEEGRLKATVELFKRESKERLGVANQSIALETAAWQHLQAAAGVESRYQQLTANNVQNLSPKLLDMQTTQAQHSGYTELINVAAEMVDW